MTEPSSKKKYIHHDLQDGSSLRANMFHSLREIVFGLEDGVVSTLGAVTGIAAGTNNYYVVILAGFVVVFVESLSMAAGTFLSSKSEHEVQQRMLAEEAEEIEEQPEQEKQELVGFYTQRGYTPEEIDILVRRVTSDKKLWLEEMAHKELGIIPEEAHSYVRDALFMGISYILGGFIPLCAYFFLRDISLGITVSIVCSLIALFILGYVKGKLVHINKIRSGLEMMLVSLSAAGLGFVVGRIVSSIFGV